MTIRASSSILVIQRRVARLAARVIRLGHLVGQRQRPRPVFRGRMTRVTVCLSEVLGPFCAGVTSFVTEYALDHVTPNVRHEGRVRAARLHFVAVDAVRLSIVVVYRRNGLSCVAVAAVGVVA